LDAARVPDDPVHEGQSYYARRITETRGVHPRNQKAELLTTEDAHGNALNAGRRLQPRTASRSVSTSRNLCTHTLEILKLTS
jgi:hypothetical protein